MRVGDYAFDNSNFAGGGFGGGGYEQASFPTDDSYAGMRRFFWLQTDVAYKAAVEALSRKRAAARSVTQNEQLNDFAHAEPVHYLATIHRLTIDEESWANRVKSLSSVFLQFPDIIYSTVDLDASRAACTW